MTTRVTPEQQLSIARAVVRKKTGWFRSMLLTMTQVEQPGLGTVASTKNAVLLYDPKKILIWSFKQVAGVIVHEIIHLWLKHHTRIGSRDPYLFNLACDMTVNPPIIKMSFELPPGVIFPRDYGFPDNLIADEYYQLLVKYVQQHGNAKPLNKQGSGGPGPKGKAQGGEEPAGVGAGRCGSCAGHAAEGEPKEVRAKDGRVAGRSEKEISRAAQQTSELMAEAARKNPGSVPEGWARMAESFLAPPKVNWRQKLAAATRNSIAYRPGALVHRYDMLNRRQSALGLGEGVPLLPRYVMPVPNVAVAIDSSGSMGEKETNACTVEVNGILKSLGCAIQFLVCDADLHGVAKIENIQQAVKMLKGGGGTDFRPVFEAVMKMKPRPEILIFETDGHGPAPEEPPPGIKTIWCLIGKNTRRPYAGDNYRKTIDWGIFIEVDTE